MSDPGSLIAGLLLMEAAARAGGSIGDRLVHAAANGRSDAVDQILRTPEGRRALHVRTTGYTPLILAAGRGHARICRRMLECGADKNDTDKKGNSALQIAADGGHDAVCRLLLDAGANKNTAASTRRTPLHHAAYNGHSTVVQMLLDAGADKTVTDVSGDTPEDDARKRGHYTLARLIRNHEGAAGGGAEQRKALEQRVAQLERALREKNDALSRSQAKLQAKTDEVGELKASVAGADSARKKLAEVEAELQRKSSALDYCQLDLKEATARCKEQQTSAASAANAEQRKQIETLRDQLQEAKEKSSELRTELQYASEAKFEAKAAVHTLRSRTDQAQKDIERHEREMQTLNDSIRKKDTQLEQLNAANSKLTAEARQAQASLDQVNRQVADMATQLQQDQAVMGDLGERARQLQQSLEAKSQGATELQGRLDTTEQQKQQLEADLQAMSDDAAQARIELQAERTARGQHEQAHRAATDELASKISEQDELIRSLREQIAESREQAASSRRRTPIQSAFAMLAQDVECGMLPLPEGMDAACTDAGTIAAALRGRLGGDPASMERAAVTALRASVGRCRAALEDRELGPAPGGDWLEGSAGALEYAPDGGGRIDVASVGAPHEIETGLLGGRARVVEVGHAKRRPGDAVAFRSPKLPDEESLDMIERGRIPPLNLPEGKAGAVQGVNGFVFAVEMDKGAQSEDQEDESHQTVALAVKGLLPLAAGNSYQSSRIVGLHREEWRVPQVLGGHRNIVPVRHSFFGSSSLIVPWIGRAFLEEANAVRRTTWLVMPRYSTSLETATKARPCTGPREAALWLLQALEATQHMISRGAVHRDIKADNFFLAGDGRLVLGDFGCGCLLFHGGRAAELERAFRGRQEEQARDHAAGGGHAMGGSGGGASSRGSAGEMPGGVGVSGESTCAAGGAGQPEEEEEEEDFGEEEEEEDGAQEEEAFMGAGTGSVAVQYNITALGTHGAPDTKAPELIAMGRAVRPLTKDSKGQPLRTLAQAYEMSDAWAAAKTVWGLLAEQCDESAILPSNSTMYRASALPRLPDDVGPLQSILRGLLVSLPSKRLRPGEAIRALRALLYGPGSWEQVQGAAERAGADGSGGPASGAGVTSDGGGREDPVVVFIRSQMSECAAADGSRRGGRGQPGSGLSWGLAGPAPGVRLPAGEGAYEEYGWGACRTVEGEASMWDRQVRREVLLRGDGADGAARAMREDCAALVAAVGAHSG